MGAFAVVKCYHATPEKDPICHDPIYVVQVIREALGQYIVVPFIFRLQAVDRMAKLEMAFAVDAIEVAWKDIQENGNDLQK